MYRTVSDVVEDLKMTLKILNNTASFRTQENAPMQKAFLLPFFKVKVNFSLKGHRCQSRGLVS